MRRIAVYALAGIALVWTGFAAGRNTQPTNVSIDIDTADAAAYDRLLADRDARIAYLTGEVSFFQRIARHLEGVAPVSPRQVTIYTTAVDISRDTVYEPFIVYRDRDVTVPVLVPDSAGHQPQTMRYTVPRNCDESLTLLPDRIICDPARLGHLYLVGDIDIGAPLTLDQPSFDAGLGVGWQPSYRSRLRVDMTYRTDGLLHLRGRINGIQFF